MPNSNHISLCSARSAEQKKSSPPQFRVANRNLHHPQSRVEPFFHFVSIDRTANNLLHGGLLPTLTLPESENLMKSQDASRCLFMGLGIILVLMSILLSIALMHYGKINTVNNRLIEKEVSQSEAAHNLNTENRKSGLMLLELLIAKEKLQSDAILPRMENMQTLLNQAFRTLDATPLSSADKDLLGNITTASATYLNSFERAKALIATGHKDEAANLINYQTLPLLDAVQEPILSLIERQKKHVNDSTQETRENIATARTLTLITGMAALIAALLIALFISNKIEQSDNGRPDPAPALPTPQQNAGLEARKVIAAAASKAKASATSPDQRRSPGAEATGSGINGVDSGKPIEFTLERKISTPAPAPAAAEVVDSMSLASNTMNNLQETLTRRHQKPAGAAQARLAQLKKNASRARMVNQPAQTASPHAHKGGQVVAQVIDTMSLINAYSNQIAGMINLIDGIAEQTNILAFNAEAEAALAGEQGRNFDMVAAEVRKLAKRSSWAAREIKGLIADSAEQLHSGTELVDQAGEAMHEIVLNVKHVTGLIQNITQKQPAAGSETSQITQAVQQINAAGWHNTALLGQMHVTAHGMQQKAEQLAHAVSLFKLGKIGTSERGGAQIVDLAAMRKRARSHSRALAAGGK